MKNILIFVLTLIVGSTKGQVSILTEVGNIHTIGVEYKFKNKYGVYVKYGSSGLYKSAGLTSFYTTSEYRVKGTFTSSVDWYDRNGTYYQELPPSRYFVSSEWGNRLLESGNVSNLVETWDMTYTRDRKLFDAGVIIPYKNITFRVGGGLYSEVRKGSADYRRWHHTFNVSKYYDEWGIIAQPSGIFVVSWGGNATEYETKTPVYEEILKPNFSVAAYLTITKEVGMGLGYDTQTGLNFGTTYNF